MWEAVTGFISENVLATVGTGIITLASPFIKAKYKNLINTVYQVIELGQAIIDMVAYLIKALSDEKIDDDEIKELKKKAQNVRKEFDDVKSTIAKIK